MYVCISCPFEHGIDYFDWHNDNDDHTSSSSHHDNGQWAPLTSHKYDYSPPPQPVKYLYIVTPSIHFKAAQQHCSVATTEWTNIALIALILILHWYCTDCTDPLTMKQSQKCTYMCLSVRPSRFSIFEEAYMAEPRVSPNLSHTDVNTATLCWRHHCTPYMGGIKGTQIIHHTSFSCLLTATYLIFNLADI